MTFGIDNEIFILKIVKTKKAVAEFCHIDLLSFFTSVILLKLHILILNNFFKTSASIIVKIHMNPGQNIKMSQIGSPRWPPLQKKTNSTFTPEALSINLVLVNVNA